MPERQAVRFFGFHADVDAVRGAFEVLVVTAICCLAGSDPGSHVLDAVVGGGVEIEVANNRRNFSPVVIAKAWQALAAW